MADRRLDDELRARIERDLAAGATISAVARNNGCSRRALTYWLSSGRVVRRRLAPAPPADATPPAETPPPAPASNVPIGEQLKRAEPGLMAALMRAAQAGDWRAGAWLLERADPKRWSQREPPAPPAPAADAFTRLDELADRRRPK